MQPGIEKNRGVGIGIDMRIGRKKKMLGKIKIVYRFRPISNRTTSTKDFICRNKGISKLASIASTRCR